VTHSRVRSIHLIIAVVAMVILVDACASVGPASSAPCPEAVVWPTELPTPPPAVVIAHPAGAIVRVTNHTGAQLKVRFLMWTPGDCGATAPDAALTQGSILAPEKFAEWSGDIPSPSHGPVMGGIELWTHPCDEPCTDPPDAYTSEILRP
jgi:hypothetical protein